MSEKTETPAAEKIEPNLEDIETTAFEIGPEDFETLKVWIAEVQEAPEYAPAFEDLCGSYFDAVVSGGPGPEEVKYIQRQAAGAVMAALALMRMIDRIVVVRIEEFPGTGETVPEPTQEETDASGGTGYEDLLS